MDTIRLGRTNLVVNKNGFGALPVQRVDITGAAALLRRAYESGIDYFDTARAYTDSEEKMGVALSDVREKIIISTKTHAATPEEFWQHLAESLRLLKTDYIDIYQFHNPAFCPKPGDGTGLYECMLEAKAQERSGLSASPTTGWRWRRKRCAAGCMTRCNSPSPIWRMKRKRRWCGCVRSWM